MYCSGGGYSGADIEAIVKDAIESAFVDGKKLLDTERLQKIIKTTQPLGAVMIVRSIQEFLARHAAPSSLQIYEEVMQQADEGGGDAQFDLFREGLAQRPLKLQVRQAIQGKHAERSERATRALAKKRSSAAKSP